MPIDLDIRATSSPLMIRCEPGAVARSVETLVELVRACGFDSRSSSSPR